MEILGFAGAIVIGATLGLIGAGGSILTVPILVYFLSVDPVLATSYSLVVVGVTALAGSITYMKKDLVSYKTAVIFAVPAFIAVFLTRKFLVPAIPQEIFAIGEFTLTKDIAVMLLFAVLMVLAAFSMIRKTKVEAQEGTQEFNYPMILLEGFIVGVLTGMVGAGGGFLIIPALVVLSRLPMKMAVGTSLLIIAAKSLLGFLGDLGQQNIDWSFLAGFTALTIAGIILGAYLARFVSGAKLKPAFGWFTLAMGVYIIGSEIYTNF
ncbi:MAG: permease [Ectothiorhodospiraceae bacterium]|nr:permease [Ectothiorhodospiraceae bacterium]